MGDAVPPVDEEHRHRHDEDRRLPEELLATREPLGVALRELEPVVGEPDEAEAEGEDEAGPDEPVGQIREEERGEKHRPEDEPAPHRRRALLLLVRLGSVLAHRGDAVLLGAHRLDVARPEKQADAERDEPRRQDPERGISQDIESRDPIGERVEQEVEHQCDPEDEDPAGERGSLIRSICMPREPLTRTTSSGPTLERSSSIASSGVEVKRTVSVFIPLSMAPSPMARARWPKVTRSPSPAPAAKRPTSRCRSSSVGPSSSMSPSTAMARPLLRTRCVRVRRAAFVLCGFAL